MVLVESARFRCPHGGEYAGLIPGKNGVSGSVRKAGDRQPSCLIAFGEIIAGMRRRCISRAPATVRTSTEMEFRRTSRAAAAVSAVWAAAVEPRRSKPPPTIAATEVSVLHIQRRRERMMIPAAVRRSVSRVRELAATGAAIVI